MAPVPAAAPSSPAAARSASTRSVRSHVKSWSARPKWPYAAVFWKIGRRRSRSRKVARGAGRSPPR